ncbi:MAG: SpoIID/LytB domain-containing protein [Terriglobales bacterium]
MPTAMAIALILCARLPAAEVSPGRTVDIGVFGLFHPHELAVSVAGTAAVVVKVGDREFILERSSGVSGAYVSISRGAVLVTAGSHAVRGNRVSITGRSDRSADFYLSVPHRIRRHYRGILRITVDGAMLSPVVTMDLEDAVASVVAAESSPGTPIEALKAQAVAARSYMAAARGRHHDFDFCDTTHCQFLRELPPANSNAAKAVEATRGLVLAYRTQVFAAMYTRSCSGRTHTPAEVGMAAGAYPYYAVECPYCRSHPSQWTSRLLERDARGLRALDEAARLEVIRRLGSAAVPSNDFVMTRNGAKVLLQGTGEGHGIGLCQTGARAMAASGADFRQILSFYYPNTTIAGLP